MSDEAASQDRSEQATPHRLAKAREKGMVARGLDLGFFVSLAAFSAYVWFSGAGVAARLAQAARDALVTAPYVAAAPGPLLQLTGAVLGVAVRPLLLLLAAIFLTVLVFEAVQAGGVFSTSPLKPDFSRLNPATGLRRLFSVRMLIESAKTLAKLAVYATLAILVLRQALQVAGPGAIDARLLADALRGGLFRLLAFFLAAAAGFAALDQLIARRDFAKRMRMSRRDVRRELRDREGDPRLKSRRRQLHAEFAKMSRSLRGVRGADVLIANPTHFAVALRYDGATMEAPQVVARGAHRFALRLRRLAFLYGVTIVHNPILARALYRCELDAVVPEELYAAVAGVYRGLPGRGGRLGAEEAHV